MVVTESVFTKRTLLDTLLKEV